MQKKRKSLEEEFGLGHSAMSSFSFATTFVSLTSVQLSLANL